MFGPVFFKAVVFIDLANPVALMSLVRPNEAYSFIFIEHASVAHRRRTLCGIDLHRIGPDR